MSSYDDDQAVRPTSSIQDYSYVSCSLVMYQDGGRGGGARTARSGGGDVNEVSTRSGSDDFDDDDSSSSEEYALNFYADTSVSSDGWSGSGIGGGDDDDPAENEATRIGDGGGGGGTSNKTEWTRSLWTIIDWVDERDLKSRDGRRWPQAVKNHTVS